VIIQSIVFELCSFWRVEFSIFYLTFFAEMGSLYRGIQIARRRSLDVKHGTLFLRSKVLKVYTSKHHKTSTLTIVNKGEWLWSPENIKRANKDAKIYVGRSTIVPISFVLSSYNIHELLNYCLIPQSVVNNYCVLCTVKAKNMNENIQQRNLSSFITISFY